MKCCFSPHIDKYPSTNNIMQINYRPSANWKLANVWLCCRHLQSVIGAVLKDAASFIVFYFMCIKRQFASSLNGISEVGIGWVSTIFPASLVWSKLFRKWAELHCGDHKRESAVKWFGGGGLKAQGLWVASGHRRERLFMKWIKCIRCTLGCFQSSKECRRSV